MNHITESHMAASRASAERIGETNINTAGRLMTIVQYNTSRNMVVQFDDGMLVVTQYANFKRGAVKHPGDMMRRPRVEEMKMQHIGECTMARNGMWMTIVKYRNNTDIDVQFEDGEYVPHVTYQRFLSGAVGHPSKIERAVPKQPIVSVAERWPALIPAWNLTKNAELTPMNTPAQTTHKIWWTCYSGHDWRATPMTSARRGCPICAAKVAMVEYDGSYHHKKEKNDD